MSRVSQKYSEGAVVLGTYADFGSALEVEMLAASGLDFVRIDGYRHGWSDDAIRDMVGACRKHGITPWGRVSADANDIARFIALGVEVLQIPSIGSAEEARAVVAAAAGRPKDFLLGCQVESREGLANLEEIVSVPGVDIIHSGRTDIARELELGPDQYAPSVLAVEERIVLAAQAAGKAVSLKYPLNMRGQEFVTGWVTRGVRLFALDNDAPVLRTTYGTAVASIRAALN